MGHKRSFDHLVGDGEECPRQFNPERLGRLATNSNWYRCAATCVAAVWTPEIAAVFKDRDVIYLRTTTNPGATKLPGTGAHRRCQEHSRCELSVSGRAMWLAWIYFAGAGS
jgi:hypothetical protein